MPRKPKTRRFYKKGKAKKGTGSKSLSLLIFILSLMVLVYSFSFVKRLTQTEAVGSPEPISVKMNILNGCGVPGAARDVQKYLLETEFEGVVFDVIDVGNFTGDRISETMIWDRAGDEKAAFEVARLLGVEKEKVSYHLLKNNYLDIKITLILGSDYPKIFEREKP